MGTGPCLVQKNQVILTFSSLTEGRQGKDQTRRLENPVARGPSSQRRMTHSSGTVWILSLATPPTHPQAKRPDGEGSESGRPPPQKRAGTRGPWHVRLSSGSVLPFLLVPSLPSSPLRPFSLLSLFLPHHPPLFLSRSSSLLSPSWPLNRRHSFSVSLPLCFFFSLSAFLSRLPPPTF